ncbi:MAG: hypothetical protein E5X67_36940, partial [Mesorhizobium sp.]
MMKTLRAVHNLQSGPRKIAPFIGGMYGGLAALALAFGFRFLMIPDPDSTSQATIAVAGLAFSICFS